MREAGYPGSGVDAPPVAVALHVLARVVPRDELARALDLRPALTTPGASVAVVPAEQRGLDRRPVASLEIGHGAGPAPVHGPRVDDPDVPVRRLDRDREGQAPQGAPPARHLVVRDPLLPGFVRRLPVAGEPVEEHLFVVPAHRGVDTPFGEPGKRLHRSGPTVDEVADREQAVVPRLETHRLEGPLERAEAPVDVAGDEVPSGLVPSDSDYRHHV